MRSVPQFSKSESMMHIAGFSSNARTWRALFVSIFYSFCESRTKGELTCQWKKQLVQAV
jgi:hypothetical protein